MKNIFNKWFNRQPGQTISNFEGVLVVVTIMAIIILVTHPISTILLVSVGFAVFFNGRRAIEWIKQLWK